MGSSGGSASGKMDYPAYMKTFHASMLDDNGADSFSISICDCVNSALAGNSPYFLYTTGQLTAADMFFGTGKVITDVSYKKPFELLAVLQAFNFDASVDANSSSLLGDSFKADFISTQDAWVDDYITSAAQPKLQRASADIGLTAVAAIMPGVAVIEDSKATAISKIRVSIEELKLVAIELAMKRTSIRTEIEKDITITTFDAMKYFHTIKQELEDSNAEFKAKDILWDIKLFQYAGSVLGAISGSALRVDDGKGNKMNKAILGNIHGTNKGFGYAALLGAPGEGAAIGGMQSLIKSLF